MPFSAVCRDSGYNTLRDIPSVEVDQKTLGTVDISFYDPSTGIPINLTDYASSSSSSSDEEFTGVKCVVKEMPEDATVWAEPTVDVKSAEEGTVEISYTEVHTEKGGIYTAEIQLWSQGHMRRTLPFFFIVTPDLAREADGGTLTIAEIRMTCRDVDPEQNVLIDQYEFSRQEIALCMRKCIDYWNESLPPVGLYKTTNFPYRFHYAKAVVAQLYYLAMFSKLRNDLPYNAGGVTVQDTSEWKEYKALADQLWADWQKWVKDIKYNINIMGGFAMLGGYVRDSWY